MKHILSQERNALGLPVRKRYQPAPAGRLLRPHPRPTPRLIRAFLLSAFILGCRHHEKVEVRPLATAAIAPLDTPHTVELPRVLLDTRMPKIVLCGNRPAKGSYPDDIYTGVPCPKR